LYEEQYFDGKRKISEVIDKLQSKRFNFAEGHVSQDLDRAKYLKKEGKIHSYVFIQKYPSA